MTRDEWINAFVVEMQILRPDDAYALRFFRTVGTQQQAIAPNSDPREAARRWHAARRPQKKR